MLLRVLLLGKLLGMLLLKILLLLLLQLQLLLLGKNLLVICGRGVCCLGNTIACGHSRIDLLCSDKVCDGRRTLETIILSGNHQ
jgi:hypothetical protein